MNMIKYTKESPITQSKKNPILQVLSKVKYFIKKNIIKNLLLNKVLFYTTFIRFKFKKMIRIYIRSIKRIYNICNNINLVDQESRYKNNMNNIQIIKDINFHPIKNKLKKKVLITLPSYNIKYNITYNFKVLFIIIIICIGLKEIIFGTNKATKKNATSMLAIQKHEKEIKSSNVTNNNSNVTNNESKNNEKPVFNADILPIENHLENQNLTNQILENQNLTKIFNENIDAIALQKIKEIEDEFTQLSLNNKKNISEELSFKQKIIYDTYTTKLKKQQEKVEILLKIKQEKQQAIIALAQELKNKYQQDNNAINWAQYQGPSMFPLISHSEIYSFCVTDELAHDSEKFLQIQQSIIDKVGGKGHFAGLEIIKCLHCPTPKNQPCFICYSKKLLSMFRSGYQVTQNNECLDIQQPLKKSEEFTISSEKNITNELKRQNAQLLMENNNMQASLKNDEISDKIKFYQNGCLEPNVNQKAVKIMQSFREAMEAKQKDFESHEIKKNNIKDEN